MNNDLSNLQMRWHASREEKLQASNKLIRVESLADELGRLSEQKSQLDLDEQVMMLYVFFGPIQICFLESILYL